MGQFSKLAARISLSQWYNNGPNLPFLVLQAEEVTSVNSSRRKASTQSLPIRAYFFEHLAIGSTICLLFLCAATAFGQSGRRGSKSPPVSVPTPEATQPEEKPRNDAPRINLLVGTNRGDVFAGIPNYMYDDVLQSCSKRLRESSSVNVDLFTREMTRSDAIRLAKEAKDGYVIWLNLRGENQMDSSSGNLSAVFIEFMAFEAVTAKVKANGNSYQGDYRRGGVVTQPGGRTNNTAAVEYRLRIAAEDAAARLLKALHIASISDIPPH